VSVLETENLSKSYGERRALDGLRLSLAEGTVCGFLGPNGVGKSTTIRLLMGFLRPTSGRASIFGRDCWRDSTRVKEDVGYLPGDLRLHAAMTSRQMLRLFGRIRRRDVLGAGLELAEELGLEPDLRVERMSRGTRQKLGLVLALAHEPRLLILDEPTTGLDPIVQERLIQRLRTLAAAGHTVFFSSHTLSEVERLCDRVVMLRGGRRIVDATLEELRREAHREVVLDWQDEKAAASTSPPPGIERLERTGTRWRFTIHGSAEELLPWLGKQPLRDLCIGSPDLESLFQSHYRADGDEEGGAP